MTEVKNRLFSVTDYHKMVEAGILTKYDHVELIDGEIIQMSPVGHRHWVCVNVANTFFIRAFERRAVMSAVGSVPLNDWTELQPDVTVFKPRADFYAHKEQTRDDVMFLVEVSDKSFSFDQKVKLPRYAAAGIPEVWIEDLRHNVLLVHRDPSGNSYDTILTMQPQASVSPLAFPDVAFSVGELLGLAFPDVK